MLQITLILSQVTLIRPPASARLYTGRSHGKSASPSVLIIDRRRSGVACGLSAPDTRLRLCVARTAKTIRIDAVRTLLGSNCLRARSLLRARRPDSRPVKRSRTVAASES